MITKKYKTLHGLVNATYYKQITFNELKSGRICHKSLGLINFKLADAELHKAFELLSSVVYERQAKSRLHRLENYCGREYGIFRRLFINSEIRGDYCAGQDWTEEMKVIKGLLRNG